MDPSYIAPYDAEKVHNAIEEAQALLQKVKFEADQGFAWDANWYASPNSFCLRQSP